MPVTWYTNTASTSTTANTPQYSFSEWLSSTSQWSEEMYVNIINGEIKPKKAKKIKYDDKEII